MAKRNNNGEIIILKVKDMEKCQNIWNVLKDKYKMRPTFEKQIKEGNRTTYIYKENDKYLAEVSLVKDMNDPDYTIPNKRIYVSRFLVKPYLRSKGIGTILMNHIVKIAKEKGYKEMSVGVNLNNYRAIKFYRKHGFDHIIKVDKDQGGKYMKLMKKI